MNILKRFKKGLLFIAYIAFTLTTFSQTRISSPYSRFGIGDLFSSTNAYNQSVGGLGQTLMSASHINFYNPASYAKFDSLSFIINTGITSNFTQLSTSNQSQLANYTTLSYISFGFPVTKNWGSSIGLLPYSNVGYKISSWEKNPQIGNIKYLYEGQGGINRFFIGNGFKINSNLSFGINTSFLFGSLDKIRKATIPDSSYFFGTKITDAEIIKGFQFNYGLQYVLKINTDYSLKTGLTFTNAMNIKGKNERLSVRYTTSSTGTETIIDTIEYSPGINGDIRFPAGIGGGLALVKNKHWMVGIDVLWQNWSEYSTFGEKDSLQNSLQISCGLEFTPTFTSVSSYWRRIHYRAGFKYQNSYLELNSTQLNEYGIAFGFGLPLLRGGFDNQTFIDLGFEIGKRGTTDNNLINENYGRITLAIALKERWFVKNKYK